jgi:hypothetical protein
VSRTAVVSSKPIHSSTARDHRLDFWRGLCLVDMVLVHLVYEGVRMGSVLTPLLGEFTRFAAGGFIFLAGLGVSYIFLPKAQLEEKRWSTYQALWRRSLYLLGVHYAASLSFIFIYPIRDFAGPYPGALAYVRDVLLFREGSDLLIFYVIMVALSPAFLEVIRRGYAWAVALFSVALFTFGQSHPYVLALPIQKNFMIVLWQMIFVMGMLAGAGLPKWDALASRAKLKIAAIACAILALIETVHYTQWGWPHFVKCPLSFAEAARYLAMITAIMMTTDLAWRWIVDGHVTAFFSRLGRRSLAVYVAHVWVVAFVIAAARRAEWIGNWQVLFVAAAIAMLWAWTCVLDSISAAPKTRGEEPALLGPAFWRLSGAAVAGIALLFALHAVMPLWHKDPVARMLSKMSRPGNLAALVADASDDPAYDPDPGPLPQIPFDDITPDDVGV